MPFDKCLFFILGQAPVRGQAAVPGADGHEHRPPDDGGRQDVRRGEPKMFFFYISIFARNGKSNKNSCQKQEKATLHHASTAVKKNWKLGNPPDLPK